MMRRRRDQLDREFTDGWQAGYDAALEAASKNGALNSDYYNGILLGQMRIDPHASPAAVRALQARRQ